MSTTSQTWEEISAEADWVRFAISHGLVYPQSLTNVRYDEGEHGDVTLDWVRDLVEDCITDDIDALAKEGHSEEVARQMVIDSLLIDREDIDTFIQDRADADDDIEVVRAAADLVIEGLGLERNT